MYLNPADHHPARFCKKLDFKHKRFHVKIRDIIKIEKKIVSVSVFLGMILEKNSQSTFQEILLKDMLI